MATRRIPALCFGFDIRWSHTQDHSIEYMVLVVPETRLGLPFACDSLVLFASANVARQSSILLGDLFE
jgi:hypothetical protein